MERRVKLTIAAIALSLLVAGMLRRMAREGEWPFSAGRPQAATDDAGDPRDAPPARPALASASSAWPHEQRDLISPAPPPLPEHEFAPLGEAPADEGVMRASFLPNPAPTEGPTAPAPWSAAPEAEQESRANGSGALEDAPPPAYPTTAQPPSDVGAQGVAPQHYVIQPGDSFWTISQRMYGTARYFQALFEHNRRICPQPDRLPAGTTIATPPREALERSYPDLLR
jgi:nucleoid-associated protein YgaU